MITTYRSRHHTSHTGLDPPEGRAEPQGLQEGQGGHIAGTTPLAQCGPEKEVRLGGRELQRLAEQLANSSGEERALASLPDTAPAHPGTIGGEEVVTELPGPGEREELQVTKEE